MTRTMFRTAARSLRQQPRCLYKPTVNTRPLVRSFACSAAHMSSNIAAVSPPLCTTYPTDSFQLLPESQKPGKAEDDIYDEQIKQVKEWWASPRYKGIKRPYSPDDVVSKQIGRAHV